MLDRIRKLMFFSVEGMNYFFDSFRNYVKRNVFICLDFDSEVLLMLEDYYNFIGLMWI